MRERYNKDSGGMLIRPRFFICAQCRLSQHCAGSDPLYCSKPTRSGMAAEQCQRYRKIRQPPECFVRQDFCTEPSASCASPVRCGCPSRTVAKPGAGYEPAATRLSRKWTTRFRSPPHSAP